MSPHIGGVSTGLLEDFMHISSFCSDFMISPRHFFDVGARSGLQFAVRLHEPLVASRRDRNKKVWILGVSFFQIVKYWNEKDEIAVRGAGSCACM